MTDIPLYSVWTRDLVGPLHPHGSLATSEDDDMKVVVLRTDHLADKAAAEEEIRADERRQILLDIEEGWAPAAIDKIQRDALASAVERVMALPHDPDCRSYRDGVCSCPWRVYLIAAIRQGD
jgi:hypothetical protein